MRLLITRHGQTHGNVKRIFLGDKDKLTKEGLAQAKKLALRLKDEKIDAIYSSPLLRAKQTAREIAKYHKHIKLVFVDELREGRAGSFEKKHYDEVDWDNMPADVESRTSIYKRAKKLVGKVFKKHPKSTVLFVGHNAVNKALIRSIKGLHPESKVHVPQSNTALTVCEISKKTHKFTIFNCTKHLE